MIWIIKMFGFTFGALVGSFINVLILRLPRGEDIVFKPSHCPKCQQNIKWFDNIPIFSSLWLRFRCRRCKGSISPRYFFTELLCALVALWLFPASITAFSMALFVLYFLIFALLWAHLVIDIEHQILPDSINIVLFIIFTALIYFEHKNWLFCLVGLLLAFSFTYGISWLFYKLRGKVGLGGGDIKLFSILGWYVGPMEVLYIIVLSSLLGTLVSLSMILLKKMSKEQYIAFGPAIILIAMVRIYFPQFFEQITRTLFLY